MTNWNFVAATCCTSC